MRGQHPHQVLLDEHDPQAPHGYVDLRNFWTPDRWEHFRKRLHRAGLLQKKGHAPGALKVPKRSGKARPPFSTPLHKPKSRQDEAYDAYLADHPQSYDTQLETRRRAQVGNRHMRRRMRRATRQAQRR